MNKNQNLKIAFFGTPYFATYVLDELEKTGLAPALIVTVPDKPAERGLEMKSPEVKLWAEKKGIPVIQPEKLDADSVDGQWDLFVVAAYGKLLPQELLDLPRHGTLNVHPSLLPRFRGPSPIETQILTDVKEVGVSVILLDEETDHGPIVTQKSLRPEPWPPRRSALEDLLWHEGGKLLAESIPALVDGSLSPVPQNHEEATFTPKLKKEDGLIDLADDEYKNYLKFSAYEGWPGTYFFIKKNEQEIRIKIIDAKYEHTAFTPTRVIPEGKKEMGYEDFKKGIGA